MLTLFFIFLLLLILVVLELSAQRWLFGNPAEKNEAEWEIYQKRYD